VRPLTLDHVAFWVVDRAPIVERCERYLGMHVIDEQETFMLVGADARRGKVTFFDADGPRSRGVLGHIGLRVSGAARPELPSGEAGFELGEGLVVRLIEGQNADDDLDHIALVVREPERTAAAFEVYGFARVSATSVGVGSARLLFEQGEPDRTGEPLLNHLGLLVESVEEHRAEAEARGLDVESVVDAANTLAVFLNGPDGIRIEYVEHKSSFSLA